MDKVIEAYKRGYRCTNEGKLLNPKGEEIGAPNNQGYTETHIRIKGKGTRIFAHRLQAFQKYGYAMFEKGIQVRHLNEDKLDFSWDNIAIGTQSQNKMDTPEHIRIARALHATSFMRKYDKEAVKAYHTTNGNSYKKTMEQFNISSKGTLNYILKH